MKRDSLGISLTSILFLGMVMSLSWCVFGMLGYGLRALLPGMLAGLAVCLSSQSDEWQKRVLYFALFGALGWAFGATMPLDRVIGYTHSDYKDSVLYGVESLCGIGFLWAWFGAMGLAIPAVLKREHLRSLCAPVTLVLFVWFLIRALTFFGFYQQDVFDDWVRALILRTRPAEFSPWLQPLYHFAALCHYHSVSWLAAGAAVPAILLSSVLQRRWGFGESFLMHLAAGWWSGFIILVLLFGVRLSPPLSDNWAGITGMAVATAVFWFRSGYFSVYYASLAAGFWGGAGLIIANFIKLYCYYDNPQIDYPRILDLISGAIVGIGTGIALSPLRLKMAEAGEGEEEMPGWFGVLVKLFLFVFVPYLVLRAMVLQQWLPNGTVPDYVDDTPFIAYFHAGYLLLVLPLIFIIFSGSKSRTSFFTLTKLAWSRIAFLLTLWAALIVNWLALIPLSERDILSVALVHILSSASTVLAVFGFSPFVENASPSMDEKDYRRLISTTAWTWSVLTAMLILVITGLTLSLLEAPTKGHFFRFGPNAWKP